MGWRYGFCAGDKVKERIWGTMALVGLLGLLLAGPVASRARAEDYRMLRSRMLARDFMAELRDGIQTAIREQGPVQAVAACRRLVSELTARYSLPPGIELKLTSRDCCNPANRPDAWEEKGMEIFLERRREGAVLAGMDFWQESGASGAQDFRYLRALPAGSLCLQCHGEHLSPKIRRALRRAGAGGQKHGDRLGELRGALAVTLSP